MNPARRRCILGGVDGVAVTARFDPESTQEVRQLLEAGPPYDLTETTLDRHAVYLSPGELVFVFEGPDVPWEVEEIADAFFSPGIRRALTEWRKLTEEPRIGHPVFSWQRGETATAAGPPAAGSVGEVMQSSPVLVAPEDTLSEAVERMVAQGVALSLVSDYGRLIGVLGAEHVLRAVAERVLPSDGRVREWMSEPPATLTPDTTLEEAVAAMVETASHHLPVAEDDRPVGVVDLRSVINAAAAQPV